jgi:putative tricarboxylic transport membrane protein
LIVAFYVACVVIVPSKYLVPVLVVLVTLGAYSFRNLMVDVFILYAFGLLGWFCRRYHFTLVSLMIGLFLGRQLDEEIVRFRVLFGNDPLATFQRPITVTFMALIVITLALNIRRLRVQRKTNDPLVPPD